MKPQSLIMLVVAAACGLAAMVLTQKYLTAPTDKPNQEMAQVVVANMEIQGGSTLNDTMLKVVEYPKQFVPEGAVAEPKSITGRATRYHMAKDEVLTQSKLAPEGVKAGLETVIEEGKRAITVATSTDRSVAGFIQPNSRVDIVLNTPSRGPKDPAMSKIILQDVKVLAVNKEMQSTADGDNKGKMVESVTVLVTPKEAQLLSLAKESGQIHLVLRSSIDKEEISSKIVTLKDILHNKGGEEDDGSSDDPDAVKLDKTKVSDNGKKGGLGNLLSMVGLVRKDKQDAPKSAVEEESQAVANTPVAQPAPVAQTPPRRLKRLIYRDLEGKPLMEVLVDADSKVAANLQHILEDGEVLRPQQQAQPGKMPAPEPAVESGEEHKSVSGG